MKNQVSEIQSISTNRDNSKAQISRYLLNNKNKLPQEIVLNWQNFEEIEGILKDEIEGDLKRINSTIGKRKPTTFKSTFLLYLIFLGVSTTPFGLKSKVRSQKSKVLPFLTLGDDLRS